MGKKLELTGQRFGRLVVVKQEKEKNKSQRFRWTCLCDCGNYKIADGGHLRTGHTQSCGCLIKDKSGPRKRPHESLYNGLIASSKIHNYECCITYEQFVNFTTNKFCNYCNSPIEWTKYGINRNGSSYFLDRVDNTKGYSVENCTVCCAVCNRMKSDFTKHTFLNHITKIFKCQRENGKQI